MFIRPALVPTGYEHLKDYDLPRVLGREVDLTVATTRLIAGGIFDRFPSLRVVIAHFGGGIAAVKDRLVAKGYRFGTLKSRSAIIMRWFISTWPDSKEEGRAQLRAPGHSPRAPRFCQRLSAGFFRREHGYRKGMDELKNYIEAIRRLPLDDKSREDILGGTAARLLTL